MAPQSYRTWREVAERHLPDRDWETTPLGPAETWSQPLKSALHFVLSLHSPAAVFWGDRLLAVPNRGLEKLLGGAGVESAAAPCWPPDWPDLETIWPRVRGGETVSVVQTEAGAALTFYPVRDDEGRVAGMIAVSAAQISDPAAEARQRELQFQSRNALAWVRSIAKRTVMTSPDIDDFVMHLDGRIDAFSRARSAAQLHPAGVTLDMLVATELLAATVREDGRAGLTGPEVLLPPKVAELFGIAIHELVTNAVKFGALSVAEGRIGIDWHIEDRDGAPWLVLVWQEQGLEGLVDTGHRGFGSEVVESTLPYELGATTTFALEPGGLRCAIEVPVSRIAAAR